MFTFRWLTRILRRHIAPKPVELCRKMTLKYSFLYMFISMNSCAYVIYKYYDNQKKLQESGDPSATRSESQVERMARLTGIKNITVIKLRNFSYGGTYELVDGKEVKSEDNAPILSSN